MRISIEVPNETVRDLVREWCRKHSRLDVPNVYQVSEATVVTDRNDYFVMTGGSRLTEWKHCFLIRDFGHFLRVFRAYDSLVRTER